MKASDFVQLMKQEKEVSSPAIPTVPVAPVPVVDAPSAEDFVKNLSIERDQRIADSGTIWDSAKDKGASLIAGVPALGKTVYDIMRMATGDADWAVYGSNKYDKWQKEAVDYFMSDAGKAKRRILERPVNDPNAGVTDVLKTAVANPDAAVNMAVESLPTMLATVFGGGGTAAAAKTGAKILGKELSKQALAKAATAGSIGTSAAMNAGDTFTSDAVQDLPLSNRYEGAALSAALSAVAGKLLDGGAEGILARNMAGQGSKSGLRGVLGGMAKEGGQEFIEEGGNAAGEQLAKREFNPNDILKRGTLGGMVGALMGGPVGGIEGAASRDQSANATAKGAPTSATLDALKVGSDTSIEPVQDERLVRPEAKIAESNDSVVGEARRVGEAQVLPGSDRVVRVQNRDRGTNASVTQMTNIAAHLDYGRLSPGRDFGNGAPVVAYGSVDEAHRGKTDYAVTADGERIPVQYAVVEAADVLASNDASGNKVPEYTTAGPDRMRVIAGNGRIAGVQRAYEQGTAANYRDEMTADAANFEIDPAVIKQMKAPVLVRIMPEDKIRTDVGSISNTSTNMDMSIVEKAVDDAANIDFSTLEFDENGNPTDETVRQFVSKFPPGQAAGMSTGDGTISQQAKARFGAALFKKAYDNDQLTAIYAESTEGEAKSILNALASVAGKMVRLEGGGDLDLRPIVAEAAEIIINARREGKTVQQYVSEGSLGQSAEAAIVAEALDANKRSGKEMRRILGQAADDAFEAMSGQDLMFGERKTREGIIDNIRGEINAKQQQTTDNHADKRSAETEYVEDRGGASPAESNVQREAVEPSGQTESSQDGPSEQEVKQAPEHDDSGLKFSRRKAPAKTKDETSSDNQADNIEDADSENNESSEEDEDQPLRYKTRTIENLTEEEQAVLDDYYDFVGEEEANRIRNNLERHWYFTDSNGKRKKTPWGHLALEAIFLRQAMRDLIAGRKPRVASMLEEKGMGPAIAAIKGGLNGIKQRISKNGILGNIDKCDFAVNSSFLNCNPSDACAAYCYAADGRGGIPLTMVKSELTDFVALNDPEWLADQVEAEFNSTQKIADRDKKKSAKTAIGNTQVALRLFEKGDGDEHWLPFIKALNERGIRVHVFSKRPEFLRKVPEMNLRLLSVDSTNRELADQNKDLRIAFVYEGEQDLDVLKKLYDRDQVGVVLPIKLKEYMEGSNVKKLKESIPGIAHHVCPIDGGSVKIGEFTCSCCDKFGCAGCMWSPDKSLTTERVLARMDEHLNRIRKMDRMSLVEKLKMIHDDISAINVLIAAAARGENVTDEQIRATGIGLESIKQYSDSVVEGSRELQRVRTSGIAFLADEVGRRLQDESRILERGGNGSKDGLAKRKARDASGGHSSNGTRPVVFWGKRPDQRGKGTAQQSSSERSDEVKLSQSWTPDNDLIERDKDARGIAGAFASRSAKKHVAQPAKVIVSTLEGDSDVGNAFKQLQSEGKVVVVASTDDLPKRIRSVLDQTKASRSAIKSVEVNIKRGKEAIEKALLEKTSVHRAMFRTGMGWVDFIWGDEGGAIKKKGNRPGEKGLAHIIEARQRKDGLSLAEVKALLDKVVHAIAKGREFKRYEVQGNVRSIIEWNGVEVQLIKNPGSNTWLLTGFYQRPDDQRAGSPAPSSTSSSSTGSRYVGSGAGLLSPRTENERHALASGKTDGLGERLSMESNSSITSDGIVLKRSDDGTIQGLYDTQHGVAYLIASNLTPETAKGVFLHEIGVHMGMDAKEDMKSLAMRARNMVNNGAKQGDATAMEVKRRMVDAGILSDVNDDIKPADAEEAFAYLVEVAANADSRSPFRKWLDSVIARIKRWLNDHGIKLKIKPDEFVEIALGNAQGMAGVKGRQLNVNEAYKKSVIGKSVEKHLGGDWGKAIQLDATGRKKFAWGEHALVGGTNVALDVLEAAIPALRTTYSIRYARPEIRRMIRDYAARCDAAVQEVGGVAQEMMKWSSADRELLSDTIEGMLKTGTLPPQHVVEAAAKMSYLMTRQAQELVELGMLSEKAAARWRGHYLPRFYKERDPLFGEDWFKNLFKRSSTIRGVGGGSLKGRGCFKVVDSAAVKDFVKLGWEIRDARYEFNEKQGILVDSKDGKGLPTGVAVTIWRDWTPSERMQMGEIRDAGYRFTMGWMQMQRDIALGRMFKAIAENPELCSNLPGEGYSQVPDTEIAETGGVKKYGALAGKYVRDDVLASIMPHAEVSSAFMRSYKKLLAYWKEGKTALNPVSHMNNCVGNIVMAHLAGVDMWNAKAYMDTILSIANHESWVSEAQKNGLYSGLFTREEIEEMLPEDFQKMLNSEKSAVARGADWVFTYVFNYGLRKGMRWLYEYEDKLFRLVIYKSALDRGLTPKEAVDYTLSFIPTYDDLPGGARAIRDTIIPFFAWTYKTIPTILLTAAKYPWRFAAVAVLLHTANALSYAVGAGDDDDDWITRWQKGRKLAEAEEKLLPDYMRGYGAFANPKFIRMWTDETTGLPVYWNISNFVPGGQMFDVNNQAGGMPWPEMLNVSSPAYAAYCALFLNVDTFMGQPLTMDSDTGMEKAEKRAAYMWRQLAPAMAAGGYHYERIMNAMANATGVGYTGVGRNGQAVTPLAAGLNTVGIKVRDVDFEQELQRRIAAILAEQREIKANIRHMAKLLDKGAVTEQSAEEYQEEQRGKLKRSGEKLEEVQNADQQRKENTRK